jgi:lactoylglutathione lyase
MAIATLTPNLMVDDMPAMLAFYCDILGFEVTDTAPPEGAPVWAQLRSGGSSIMLQTRASLSAELPAFREQPVGATQTLFITMDDEPTFETLYTRARGAGAVIKQPYTTFYGAREYCLRDPEGYLLVLAWMMDAAQAEPASAPAQEGDA